MRPFSFFSPHRRWHAMVDAHVDGALARDDAARFGAHLTACPECVFAVEESRRLKRLLSALPELAAPRSFRLTPAMLALPTSTPTQVPVAAARPHYALRLVQAGAALALAGLVAVAAIDLTSNSTDGGQPAAESSTDGLTAQTSNSATESSKSAPAAATAAATSAAAPAVEPVPTDTGGTGVRAAGGVDSPTPAPETYYKPGTAGASSGQGDTSAAEANPQDIGPREPSAGAQAARGDDQRPLHALELMLGAALAATLAGWLILRNRDAAH